MCFIWLFNSMYNINIKTKFTNYSSTRLISLSHSDKAKSPSFQHFIEAIIQFNFVSLEYATKRVIIKSVRKTWPWLNGMSVECARFNFTTIIITSGLESYVRLSWHIIVSCIPVFDIYSRAYTYTIEYTYMWAMKPSHISRLHSFSTTRWTYKSLDKAKLQ